MNSIISYTTYVNQEKSIKTCEYYEKNNLLESPLWIKGTLSYENGQIKENEEEILAKDVCK